ncbi:MAG: pirin family protein [Micavibrio sp.]
MSSLISLTIPAREADIGGMRVRRLLPYAKRRMIGPFIFLDHMGPAQYESGEGLDVRPHPHIGLSTLTYLFSGTITHRDSLGSHQDITPGAVNWMTAGQGISHSERTGPAERTHHHNIHGLQSWIALPREYEEQIPSFSHHEASLLPSATLNNVRLKVIAGAAYDMKAPVPVFGPLFYVEVFMPAGTRLPVTDDYPERGAYIISGDVAINDWAVEAGTLPVFLPDGQLTIEARTDSHLVLLGGDALPEQRFIWWNFVSTSKDRIEQAKEDWRQGRFGTIPDDMNDALPLPE